MKRLLSFILSLSQSVRRASSEALFSSRFGRYHPSMNPISKTLIILGVALIAGGLLYHFFGPFFSGSKTSLGKLPGDIFIKGKSASFYFPIATCFLLSAVLSLIFYLFRK